MKEVGIRILEARKKKALTQKQLSELSRITQPNIARYENGVMPSPRTLQKLAKCLDVSVDYFHIPLQEAINHNEFDETEFDKKIRKLKDLPVKRKKSLSGILDAMLDLHELERTFQNIKSS